RNTATPNPLINPNIPPITKVTNKGTIRGNTGKSAYILDAKSGDCSNEAPITAASPNTRPADKSVPCKTINPASPNAIIVRVEAWLKIFVKFRKDKKDGSKIIMIKINIPKTIYKE